MTNMKRLSLVISDEKSAIHPISVGLPQAAELIGLSRHYLWRLTVQDHVIPHVKVGKRILVLVKDLEDWLERQKVAS